MTVHPSAIIEAGAELGADVSIGPFCIVHAGVRLGDRSRVEAYCELGLPTPLAADGKLSIGADSLIRSHSVFYAGSSFGAHLRTGHRVTVRELTRAGSDLQIGTLSDIQGHCEIGDHVRTHSNVHIGHKSRVGDYAWIFPYVVLTNDPHPPSEHLVGCTLDEFAVIATMSVVLPGVRVGRGAFVGAMTMVKEDVPPDTICVGVPGKNVGPTSKIKHRGTGAPAYPWRRHFHRGYPAEAVALWKAEFDDEAG
ncbi:MAG TPA: N-acetyltransferase [Gammaproteobacteria bacterium]|jgi:acyl-[acyl carrier protein]--UDP-N-acetylglucosamine O-acyltransferase